MRRVVHRAARFLAVTLQAPGRISARRKQQRREAGKNERGFRHRFPPIGIDNVLNMLRRAIKSIPYWKRVTASAGCAVSALVNYEREKIRMTSGCLKNGSP